ncbi:unannotated protein [freshwater metagenome]|uniref:Unannotated protein n=1 Tax=freshwater metagenome TaxID=449393 RepID=A0A6J6DQH7_9ZZZZ
MMAGIETLMIVESTMISEMARLTKTSPIQRVREVGIHPI